jgi:hypothetical protein
MASVTTVDWIFGAVLAGGVAVNMIRARGKSPQQQAPWLFTRDWTWGSRLMSVGVLAILIDLIPGMPFLVGAILGFGLIAAGIVFVVCKPIRRGWISRPQ